MARRHGQQISLPPLARQVVLRNEIHKITPCSFIFAAAGTFGRGMTAAQRFSRPSTQPHSRFGKPSGEIVQKNDLQVSKWPKTTENVGEIPYFPTGSIGTFPP